MSNLGVGFSVRHEYRRKVRRLSDLPVLAGALRELDEEEGGRVVVECLTRLLQKADILDRHQFLNDLMQYRGLLFGALQKRRLSDYDQQGLIHLMMMKPGKRVILPGPSRPKRKRDTTQATSASKLERKRLSARDTETLAQIKQELIDQGRPATLKEIAAEANARGHRNQRGNEWTEAAVSARLSVLARQA